MTVSAYEVRCSAQNIPSIFPAIIEENFEFTDDALKALERTCMMTGAIFIVCIDGSRAEIIKNGQFVR